MRIYIPTYGRGDHQPVYWQLHDHAGWRPTLLVDERDPFDYGGFDIERHSFTDLKSKEQWLAQLHFKSGEPYAQIDDDLLIKRSRVGAPIKYMARRDYDILIELVYDLFKRGAAQVGVHHRTFVNYATHPFTWNVGQFPFRVKFYNTPLWRNCPRPCPGVDGHNDVWTWHELVRQGLDYAIITDFCHVDALYTPKKTHFEPDFADKVKGFDKLIDHMGIDRSRFTRPGKHGPSLQYALLAKHYRQSSGRTE